MGHERLMKVGSEPERSSVKSWGKVSSVFIITRGIKGGFLGGSNDKESACNAGDPGQIPGWGRFPGGPRHGHPLQCSCLKNPLDRGAWWATIHWVAELDMTED